MHKEITDQTQFAVVVDKEENILQGLQVCRTVSTLSGSFQLTHNNKYQNQLQHVKTQSGGNLFFEVD